MRKSKKQTPKFDEFFVLRLDSSRRPRGARFAKLEDKVASASIDMKCHALILQLPTVQCCAWNCQLDDCKGASWSCRESARLLRHDTGGGSH
jgi:hypothetical protein